MTPAFAGSSSSRSAIATEKSGAVPTVTEVRDGPASRIGEGEEELRAARAEHAGEQERPDRRRGRSRLRRRTAGSRRAPPAIVQSAPASASGDAGQRESERDRHRAEEGGRGEREHDRIHRRQRYSGYDPARAGPAHHRAGRTGGQPVPRRAAGLAGLGAGVTARTTARPTEVARAIARRGAYYLPRINWGPERFRVDLDWALEAPLELLGELPPIERHAGRARGRAADDPLARGRPRGRRARPRAPQADAAGDGAGQHARPSARRALGDRRVPDRGGRGREAGMSLEEYTEFIFDACLLDWDAEEARMTPDQGALRPRKLGAHRRRGNRPHDRDRGSGGRRLRRLPQHA